tara:strand:+ start:16050 stop:16433 length:384 start_codon:yes stop_codon:yes gene_type:complete
VEEREYTLQVVDVNFADATGAGIQVTDFNFDSQFERVEGVALIETSNGGDASAYKVGFTFPNDNRQVRSVHNSLYKFAAATPQDQRFAKINATAKGASFSVATDLPAATSAALTYQLVFRLSKAKNC